MKKLILLSLITLSTANAFTINTKYLKMKPKHKAIIQKAEKRLNKALGLIKFDQIVLRRSNPLDCLYNHKFDRTGIQNEWELVKFLEGKSVDFNIGTYSTLYPGVIAKTVKNNVYFKKSKLDRNVNKIANTLFHEALHIAGFGHCGKNKRDSEVENSAPYILGDEIEDLLNGLYKKPGVTSSYAIVESFECGVLRYKSCYMSRRARKWDGRSCIRKLRRHPRCGVEKYKSCLIKVN